MSTVLEKEFEYYLDHQDEMVRKYNGQVVAIKDGEVLGAYADLGEAYRATLEHHDLGTFLLQKVSRGSKDYTSVFQRVSFS